MIALANLCRYRDPRADMLVTQFNMKWVEKAGLVKFDFLGLKTLTVLQKTIEFIAQRGIEVDLGSIPLDDKGTFDMFLTVIPLVSSSLN